MKTMNCRQLGGACDMEFQADTFDAMAALSKQHGMQMFKSNDPAHLEAMQQMQALMQEPSAMQKWFTDRKQEFDALPED